DELWGGIPRFTDVGIHDNGDVFFIEQEKDSVAADPSLEPGSSNLIIGGPRSPISVAGDLLEVDDLLGASRLDASAFAADQQAWKDALDATGLEDEGRVDIPIVDDPVDPVQDDPKTQDAS
ncbi:hypothetical protein Dimus_008486, partial [Dionaea muscipula]